jgi:hypothetical protein
MSIALYVSGIVVLTLVINYNIDQLFRRNKK